MASSYLTNTFGTPTDQNKWTFSCWVKLGTTSDAVLFSAGTDASSNVDGIKIDNNQLRVFSYNGSAYVYQLKTSRLFRDLSAWYHIVVMYDSDQATSSDRIKVYVNGTQETSFGTETYPSSGANSAHINLGSREHIIGADTGGANNTIEGLITHIHFTDGYAYAGSDFGETDSTSGIWKPKTSPSVTYGTNGFFLKMENSGAMGTDSSGNGNNFTVSGTITQTEDTPSNNFATLNAVYKAAYQPTFSTGNLTATAPNSGQYYPAFSSLGIETGKFYMEYKIGAAGSFHIGICSENDANTVFPTTDNYMGESSKSVGISDGNGSYYISASATSYGSSYTSGDIIGLALDMTNKKLYVSKNGTFFNSADPASETGGIDISGILSSGDIAFFAHSCYGGTGTRAIEANFGNGRFGTTAVASSNSDSAGLGLFEYSVPSGYYALCTKNIKNYG